jgi:hypothetical protein
MYVLLFFIDYFCLFIAILQASSKIPYQTWRNCIHTMNMTQTNGLTVERLEQLSLSLPEIDVLKKLRIVDIDGPMYASMVEGEQLCVHVSAFVFVVVIIHICLQFHS